MERLSVLGVDIGNVIIASSAEKVEVGEPGFDEWFLGRSEVSGAIDTIAELARGPFEGRVHLITKRKSETNEMTFEWLRRHRFFDRVGMPESNVHFCRRREEKNGICQTCGVTHFVDDRLEVLSHLVTVPHRFLFNADEIEVAAFHQALDGVTCVASWSEIYHHIISHP